jgi:predicted nucleotidyltransferase
MGNCKDVLNKDVILTYLKENKENFRKKYQVNKIGLCGSYSRGDETKKSDIDIIVNMHSSFDNFYDFKYELENYFGKEVDLGMEDAIRPFIKSRIEKDMIYV